LIGGRVGLIYRENKDSHICVLNYRKPEVSIQTGNIAKIEALTWLDAAHPVWS